MLPVWRSPIRKKIQYQLTVPNNPAQNGVAERMNRTLMESVRGMISHSCLPYKFWAEAMSTSVHLRNRSPTGCLDGVALFECLFKRKPDVSNLRVFGCTSYVHGPDAQRTKLDPKSKKSIFVGIPKKQKDTNFMTQIPESLFVVVMSFFKRESFMTLDVNNLYHMIVKMFLLLLKTKMMKTKMKMLIGEMLATYMA